MRNISTTVIGHYDNDRYMWAIIIRRFCDSGGLHQSGLFSVKSMYRALLTAQAIHFNTFIWKLKLPLKIKVFLWYLFKGVILTKDNLVRRQWQGDRKCLFVFLTTLYNIYSLTVILLNSCGVLFMFPLIYYLQLAFTILFTGWLNGINRKLKSKILVGASVIC
jgi:hypothetical protein